MEPPSARVEWAAIEAVFAPQPELSPTVWNVLLSTLTQEQWLEARLLLHPGLRLLESQWRFDQEGTTRPSMCPAGESVYYAVSPDEWIELDPGAYFVLSAIQKGMYL
jgi:hypothetical protein